MNLPRILAALDRDAAEKIYRDARQRGDEQTLGALRLAHPYLCAELEAKPGQLKAVTEVDASGRRITRYAGDPKAWRKMFDAEPIRCWISNPRFNNTNGLPTRDGFA